MKTLPEVTQKMKEVGFLDVQISNIKDILLPIGAKLKHRKVSGQVVTSYLVSSEDGLNTVHYITDSGSQIGVVRESKA